MKRFVFLLVILLVFVGCAEKRHLRKRAKAQKKILDISLKYPELFDYDTTYIEVPETLYIPVENYIFDTVVESASDTIVIENERIITVIKPFRDIRTNEVIKWQVRTEIKADTIEYIRNDTIIQIDTEIEPKTVTKKVKYIPWWIWLIIGALVFLVFWISAKTLENGK